MMKTSHIVLCLMATLLIPACTPESSRDIPEKQLPEGKLFIIGGGKRPAELVVRLITESGVDSSGYALVMPMASADEDTAIYYSSRQFTERGIRQVLALDSMMIALHPDSAASLTREARLIYISGGAQARFMNSIAGTEIGEAIHQAYLRGATISGTSAGAAVMSEMMITGDQVKHPVYTGDFQTIEANNIVLEQGLGLLESAIIDQHFVKRQRLNRLISVILENPGQSGFGIDESTALLVKDGMGIVVGESQVIQLTHPCAETKIVNGLLGGKGMELSVYLPGDTIYMKY